MILIKPFTLALLTITATALGNELTCDGDFVQNGNSCYKLMDGMTTSDDAIYHCKAKGGEMVSIHSREENDFIATFGVDVLIGLWYFSPLESYFWHDGSPVDMENWEQNYPKNTNYNGKCVLMQKSGKWINFQCDWKARYACKKALSSHQCPVQPDNQFLDEGQVTSPGYPGNYIKGVSCTYELTVENTRSVTINVTEMIMGDGDTIEIFSRLDDDKAYRIAKLVGNLTVGPKTFKNPKGENRMLVKFTSKSQNGGYWKFNFIDGYCPTGWISGGEVGLKYCYKLIMEQITFKNAKSRCESEGAQLLSVHNAFQNKFITGKAHEKQNSHVWLGLVYENGSWKWADGTAVEYTNWLKGEPYLYRGNCTAMIVGGGWLVQDCGLDNAMMCYKKP